MDIVNPEHFDVYDYEASQAWTVDGTALRDRFERDGVVIFPGFYSRDELDAVNEALREHFSPIEPIWRKQQKSELNTYACDVVPWDPCAEEHELFLRMRDEMKLRMVTRAVLGDGFGAPESLVMFSVPGGRGQAWHQDCPNDKPNAFNLNRLIYTADVTEEDGAIVYVPGSHRRGRIPLGGHQESMAGEVALTPKAGTLVFLHGHVYHRVTPNRNQKPRNSVNFRAYPEGIGPDVNCIGVYRNGIVNFCDQPKHHDGTPADPVYPGEVGSQS